MRQEARVAAGLAAGLAARLAAGVAAGLANHEFHRRIGMFPSFL
jgi:uncharacterized membrane protein YcjF (UPF0283 family)